MTSLLNRIKNHWKACLLICSILFFKICFLIPFVESKHYLLALLMEMLVLLCVSLGGRSLLLRMCLFFPIGIEAAQYASLYSTGHYVIPLTLLNMGNAHVIGDQLYVVSAIILLFILLSYVNIYLAGKLNIFSRKWPIFALLGYISLAIFMLIAYNHQDRTKKYPFPIENMAYVSFKVIKVLSAVPTPKYAKLFEKKYIPNNFKNTVVPQDFKDYNIVTIFLEGTSTTVLSDSLTPCLKKLQSDGINIINYYNHTASTFRGIRGQLISGYSLKGIAQYNDDLTWATEMADNAKRDRGEVPLIESLPLILEKNGYTTVFISPHNKNDRLAPVMKRVGFQQVFTAENFERPFTHLLSDKQSYEFLWQELMELKTSDKPFFLCLYQVGTHHGLDSPDKKYGDGQSTYLNKFYNADFWLGNFVDKFLADSISDNTILIITADHATYPTPEYRKTFNSAAQYFFDEIPFVILIKGIQGKIIDAHYKNSLSFAPTVLDILGIDSEENHFLGDSLFLENQDNPYSHIGCMGFDCYHTGKTGVKMIEDDEFKDIIELIQKYYTFSG